MNVKTTRLLSVVMHSAFVEIEASARIFINYVEILRQTKLALPRDTTSREVAAEPP